MRKMPGRPPIPKKYRRNYKVIVFLREHEFKGIKTASKKYELSVSSISREVIIDYLKQKRLLKKV